jgi:hypothetical protein
MKGLQPIQGTSANIREQGSWERVLRFSGGEEAAAIYYNTTCKL